MLLVVGLIYAGTSRTPLKDADENTSLGSKTLESKNVHLDLRLRISWKVSNVVIGTSATCHVDIKRFEIGKVSAAHCI